MSWRDGSWRNTRPSSTPTSTGPTAAKRFPVTLLAARAVDAATKDSETTLEEQFQTLARDLPGILRSMYGFSTATGLQNISAALKSHLKEKTLKQVNADGVTASTVLKLLEKGEAFSERLSSNWLGDDKAEELKVVIAFAKLASRAEFSHLGFIEDCRKSFLTYRRDMMDAMSQVGHIAVMAQAVEGEPGLKRSLTIGDVEKYLSNLSERYNSLLADTSAHGDTLRDCLQDEQPAPSLAEKYQKLDTEDLNLRGCTFTALETLNSMIHGDEEIQPNDAWQLLVTNRTLFQTAYANSDWEQSDRSARPEEDLTKRGADIAAIILTKGCLPRTMGEISRR